MGVQNACHLWLSEILQLLSLTQVLQLILFSVLNRRKMSDVYYYAAYVAKKRKWEEFQL